MQLEASQSPVHSRSNQSIGRCHCQRGHVPRPVVLCRVVSFDVLTGNYDDRVSTYFSSMNGENPTVGGRIPSSGHFVTL